MGEKTYKCRYAFCRHPDNLILPTDNYEKVGRSYFHSDCYKKKKKGEEKDKQTKADLQEIKVFWVENISKTVNYGRLFQILNEFIARGISSDYILFVVKYCANNKYKLSYPDGIKYYLDKSEIKAAYEKHKSYKTVKAQREPPQIKLDEPNEERAEVEEKRRIIKPRKGFQRILRGDKNKEI